MPLAKCTLFILRRYEVLQMSERHAKEFAYHKKMGKNSVFQKYPWLNLLNFKENRKKKALDALYKMKYI